MTNDLVLFLLLVAFLLFAGYRWMSIRSGISEKRALANEILGFGSTPRVFVEKFWNGHDYSEVEEHLERWDRQIRNIAARHRSDVLLHDFPAGLSTAIAVLDDSLSIFLRCVASGERPDGRLLLRVRGAINELLKTLQGVGVAATTEVPARPVFPERVRAYLGQAGFESEGEFIVRRSTLLAWVRHDQGSWYDDQPTFHLGPASKSGKSKQPSDRREP